MSEATLRERIIDELKIAHQEGRTYPAPVAWNLDNENSNAKPLAESLAKAIIPEITVAQVMDLPMLDEIDFPDALPNIIRLFADTAGRVLKRYPNGIIEEMVSTDYRQ